MTKVCIAKYSQPIITCFVVFIIENPISVTEILNLLLIFLLVFLYFHQLLMRLLLHYSIFYKRSPGNSYCINNGLCHINVRLDELPEAKYKRIENAPPGTMYKKKPHEA